MRFGRQVREPGWPSLPHEVLGPDVERGPSGPLWLRGLFAIELHLDQEGRRPFHDSLPLFTLANPCGTCNFLFERLVEDEPQVRVPAPAELATMLSDLDLEDRPVVLGRFAELLPHGRYRAVSLSLSPQLIEEGSAEDFFQRERRAFGWNLPDDEGDDGPDTDYYRAGLYDRGGEPLYVFVVPLQLPETLHEGTVTRYRTDLAEGKTPTVVTFGVLYRNWLYANMSRPLVGDPDGPTRAEVLGAAAGHFASIDSYWTLTLFVLDGHHKLAAAAHDGAPMDLLSLVWEGPDPRLLDEVFPPIEGPAPRPAQAQ